MPRGEPARSDALVLFGATGDLAHKKIFPALYAMARRGNLDLPLIGVSLSGWTLEQMRARARESVEKHCGHAGGVDRDALAKLESGLRYIDGDYRQDATFAALFKSLGGAKRPLHYLAIPPDLFGVVVNGLGKSGCARQARIVVEKPFGRDLASARALNATLHAVFAEQDIFRIDHFLGKEAVQNLLVFRFANTFLEPIWNNRYVRSVQVTLAESFGVEGRGRFYDGTGASRDVIQNHLLQVVGFLAMEPPAAALRESISDEQVKVFRQIRPLTPSSVERGQFHGYRDEEGVAPGSRVETFAAVRLDIDSPRWEGVPFLVRSGKRLAATVAEVLVTLKRPALADLAPGDGNYVRFRLSPAVTIAIGARVKRVGEELTSEPAEFEITHRPGGDEMDAYERLLGEAMTGDAMLFARQDTVEAAWTVVDPVLGDVTPLHEYEPGSWGPSEADILAADSGGWHRPTS